MTGKKRLAAVVLAALSVGGGLFAGSPTSVSAAESNLRTCPNTYCLPGWSTCNEHKGWQCTLSGGCASYTRCGLT